MPFNNLISRSDVAARVPEAISSAMLTTLAARSAALTLGQQIPIATTQVRFPVLAALPTAYFVAGDTGVKQTTEAAWDNRFLQVEEIATIVPIPDAVLDDAGFDVWGAIRPLMEQAISRKLDAAVFFGADAPASWVAEGNIVGDAVAAGNTVTRGANPVTAGGVHGDLSDLVGLLEADGYIPNGAVGNVTLRARLRQVRDNAGNVLPMPADIPDPTYALPGLWPTGAGSAELIVGDWTNLVVGVRQDMTYKLITEGVITDNGGNIIYNLPQQDMVALRLVFRAGYAVSNPINYQNADEGARYPFAVLRAA